MSIKDRQIVLEDQMIYQYYRDRLITLALSQFRYGDLPDTCDRRYFERQLLHRGSAALYQPEGTDMWLSTGYVFNSNFDGYGRPAAITGVDFNARKYKTDRFVIFYDNDRHGSLMPWIDMYAKLLYETHNTMRSNLRRQITPYVFTGPSNIKQSVINMMRGWVGYEPYFVLRNESELKLVSTLNTRVPYLGNDIMQTRQTLWVDAITMLGISVGTSKRERQNKDELAMNRQENALMAMSRLGPRMDGCERFRELSGINLTVHIADQDLSLPCYEEFGTQGKPEKDVPGEKGGGV